MPEENQLNINSANIGLNLNSTLSQFKKGQLSFALNATVEGFDGNSVNYQNELGNDECFDFPSGYKVLGKHPIYELDYTIFFLVNPVLGISEIGKATGCKYEKIVSSTELGFDINYPIRDVVHRITNCSVEIYWDESNNRMRYMDLNNIPLDSNGQLIVNQLSVQPNFSIPEIKATAVTNGGSLVAGVYEFAIQYANANGEAYTSFYSIIDPVPIFDVSKIGLDFNYVVGQAIKVDIKNIDTSGIYEYFNLAVIKTINNVPTPELVGTYKIDKSTQIVTYSGQTVATAISLSIKDIFQKYPVYDSADDLTTVGDILIHTGVVEHPRLNYQDIASKIHPQWMSYRIPSSKGYSDPLVAANFRSAMRDEIYPYELVFLLTNGKQTDSFPMYGRDSISSDRVMVMNDDVIGSDSVPTWKVYNTASITGFEPEWNLSNKGNDYEGPYEYGEFAYVESTDTYPNIPLVYGSLAGKPIRHFKYPDNRVSNIHDDSGNIYPIGMKINVDELKQAIATSGLTLDQQKEIVGFKVVRGDRANNKSIVAKGLLFNVGKYTRDTSTYFFPNYPLNDLRTDPFLDNTFYDDDSKRRFTMHSPDTSFYQPFLGNVLKFETVEYGVTDSDFQQVKGEAKQKLFTTGLYLTSAALSIGIGFLSATIGLSTQVFNGVAAMATYQTLTDLFQKIAPRINYAYQLNSVGKYEKSKPIDNNGNKQRKLDIANYAISGVFSNGDTHLLNNFHRESSVYLRATKDVPYPHQAVQGVNPDNSRYTLGCDNVGEVQHRDVSAYYATIKNNVENQYGQIGDYTVVDTGAQYFFRDDKKYVTIFGGDTFINRFALKRKLPFFTDNRVGAGNDADVFYNEIVNVGSAKYWFSNDSNAGNTWLGAMFGTPTTNLDCQQSQFIYKTGKMYLFAYGIPYFFCESQVNVDFRQAYNGKEGDFFPHVSTGIPDDWLQEETVSIAFDNTYTYNKSYSKQNSENYFSHLPLDWTAETCRYVYPFKSIYSEPRLDTPNTGQRNNWLIYKPISYFDFPQNYGRLISLDGIEDRAILARFENKSLFYNNLLTVETSLDVAAYLGNNKFFKGAPPMDVVNGDTDQGYVGTQNKMLVKTQFGNITVDTKRGQIFVLNSNQATDITSEKFFVNRFFGNELPFKIIRHFPDCPVDNSFNGIGIHGVYDSKFKRVIITKLDYEPVVKGLTFNNGKFYDKEIPVELTDKNYFCNKSFTVSFDFRNLSWISFHSYLPNFYVGWSNSFYSGLNIATPSLWKHLDNIQNLNNFYGEICPYILEYPYAFQFRDEILQNIKDYTKVLKYNEDGTYIETDNIYFNKAILSNSQQCSGILELVAKPKNNLSEYGKYPIYNLDSKTVIYTKSDNFYNYNTFWSMIKDKSQPIFINTCENLSVGKQLNQDNMDYSKRSFKKEPLRAKELKVRHILDSRSDVSIVSQFIVAPTTISYK